MSAKIDLMEATRQCPLIVQEGESLNVTGQLVDFAGVPIPKAGLSSFEVTLHDEATKAIINSIERQDRLAQVASDGSFTLKFDADDNAVLDSALSLEKHVLAMYWSWHDGERERTGIQLVRWRVQRAQIA